MEGTIKKIMMLALSVAVALAMSVPVFADTGSTGTKINSINDLKEAVKTSGTYILNGDADFIGSITIPANVNVTIDLNGHTLKNNEAETTTVDGNVIGLDTIYVEAGGTLTLTGSGTVDNVSNGSSPLDNRGTATIDGPTLKRSSEAGKLKPDNNTETADGSTANGNSCYTVENHGTLNIKSGTVENNGSFSSCIGNMETGAVLNMTGGTVSGGQMAINNKQDGTINISGGTVKDAALFAIANGGTATITGGTFNGGVIEGVDATQSGVLENFGSGTMKISQGTFNANDSDGIINFVKHSNFTEPNSNVTITGGTFKGTLIADHIKDKVTIKPTGGTFSVEPTVPTGYVTRKNSDGTYTVCKVNSWTTPLTIKGWTYGETANKPDAAAEYGDVTYKYYDSNKKELGSEQPTNAGSYYVKAFVAAGADYTGLESDYVPFTIAKASDSKLTKDLTISGWTYGQTPSTPSAEAADGTITYKYYDKDGNLLTEAPTLPGTYYVTASVTGAANSEDFESAKVKFTIYKPVLNAKAQKKTKTSDKITWTKVKGADGYVVYFGKCGKSMKKIASTKKSLSTVKKHLAKGKTYKYQVKAYKVVDGKRVVIAKSFKMHTIANGYNSKYTDAKSVKVADSSITIKLNKSKKIKPSLTKYKSGKKFLSSKHAARYRYQSSDKTVAVVSASGKVSAVKTGSCKIYVCAPNGVWKTVKVKVAE